MPAKPTKHVFRPRARLLILLGDQLIRDAGVAAFELVKNAYDADATECMITLINAESEDGQIVISDDGTGMTYETVTKVWLEPGTDYRKKQMAAGKSSRKFLRVPLGEKGVGRFAAHKMGQRVTLITRARRSAEEVVVNIDWNAFERDEYLADVPVNVIQRKPEVFKGSKSGTRLEISMLREKWTRGRVRDLQRSVTAICSPFAGPKEFRATLRIEPPNNWLANLLDIQSVSKLAMFRIKGTIRDNKLTYRYQFTPSADLKKKVETRSSGQRTEKLEWVTISKDERESERLTWSEFEIGTAKFDLRVFDRDPHILSLLTSDKAGLKKFLDINGGVRIYRNGIRVFDFGEPGNDWLDLGGRRVNVPSVRISNNQIIGVINLDRTMSTDLVEKTNREGFIESAAYRAFREAVLFSITQFEAERHQDKERLRIAFSSKRIKRPVIDELAELRAELDGWDLPKTIYTKLDRVERQYIEMQDRLLTAAGTGLTLTAVIHEVEKGIAELHRAVQERAARSRIRELVDHITKMVDGLAFLARKSGRSTEKASALIDQALFNSEYRLRAHGVEVIRDPSQHIDFSVKCVRRLVIATLMNFVDNSIYWLDNQGGAVKRIYVEPVADIDGGPGIVFADSGPGYADPPDALTQPFFSRRPDGMGLGLYIADEVAKLHKGRLLFPEAGDIELPKGIDGAVVIFQFGKG